MISAQELKKFLPEQSLNPLPVIASGVNGGYVSETTFANERDILYKIIFDLKKDMNEMKHAFVELIKNPSAIGANSDKLFEAMQPRQDTPPITPPSTISNTPVYFQPGNFHPSGANAAMAAPAQNFDDHEEVEESLNILDMEKELIIKALKKHKSKRKDAALDLGISERTLYRKLKEYDIENL